MATEVAANPPAREEYDELTKLLREVSNLRAASGILGWDEQVMMAPGSSDARGAQKAALAGVIHEKATGNALEAALDKCEATKDGLDEFQLATLRDARRSLTLTKRISKELSQEIATAETEGVTAWAKARKENDWKSFAPYMKRGLELARKCAEISRPDMKPYDAAIDTFERGMTADRLREIFGEVVPPLKELLTKVTAAQESGRKVKSELEGGPEWDIESQAKLCKELATKLGFDFTKGRIDVSVHPFTGGAGPEDTRITTRYSTGTPFEGIMGTVHEVGHALYEQGRNPDHEGLPVSEALSMGAHESQSLFWERMVAQSDGFWSAVLDEVHENLPVTKSASAGDIAFAVNRVNAKGLIRVDADELSYPFHIILRFEIESGLFDGSIDVEDLPRVWNQKMKEYFDVDVPSDAEGCLQDVHWPSLAFGYFPSYTLGAMTAAQLYAYMDREALPGMEGRVAKGEFASIKEWLNTNFHKLGSLHTSLDDLLLTVTGEKLNPTYFITYLQEKYTRIYELS